MGHGEGVSQVSKAVYDYMLEFMNNPESHVMLAQWNKSVEARGIDALTTAVVGGVYVNNRRLHYAYAGHHPALLLKNGSNTWEPIPVNGQGANFPLGVSQGTTYDQADRPVTPGDKLFLYTDGLIEARDSEGNLFGAERLMDVLDSAAGEGCAVIKSKVLEAVRTFSNDRLDHDDLTLLAIEL